MKLPPLNSLRAFESAARHLSFSKAGDELCVTHAAISHQIKLLEGWLERPLFEREGRGVRLNAAGLELYDQLAQSLPPIARVCARLKQAQRQLKVGCIPSIASRWLIPALPAFREAHPDIQVSLLYARAEERLADGDYDLLVTLGRDPSPEAQSTRLFSRANRPVCSPHYLARHGRPETAGAILEADLLHDESEKGWRDWAVAAGVDESVRRSGQGPVFQDSNLMMTAAIAGHGIALCPVDVFSAEIARGDLMILSSIATQQEEGYFLIERCNDACEAQLFSEWFRDLVKTRTGP